jgi:hypothetical protein
MTGELPSIEETARWRRRFAAEGNNRAWDLASQPERSAEDVEDMVYAAYAAAYHWKQVGQPVNHSRADVTLAHALSLAGQGSEALKYARRSLEFFESTPCEDWDIAFAHLEMALAAAVLKDSALHAFHYSKASELGHAIQEEEDRQVFLTELARIPQDV